MPVKVVSSPNKVHSNRVYRAFISTPKRTKIITAAVLLVFLLVLVYPATHSLIRADISRASLYTSAASSAHGTQPLAPAGRVELPGVPGEDRKRDAAQAEEEEEEEEEEVDEHDRGHGRHHRNGKNDEIEEEEEIEEEDGKKGGNKAGGSDKQIIEEEEEEVNPAAKKGGSKQMAQADVPAESDKQQHQPASDANANANANPNDVKPIILPGAPEEKEQMKQVERDNAEIEAEEKAEAAAAAAGAAGAAGATNASAEGPAAAAAAEQLTGRSAKIVTCPACRLNALPQVKRFVHELAKHFEPALKVEFKIGEDPVLHLFDNGNEIDSIPLDTYTSQKIIQKLAEHGLKPTSENEEINKAMREMEASA